MSATESGGVRHDYLMQFFNYDREVGSEVDRLFAGLAQQIVSTIRSNPERSMALRKLLEAKDCATRAKVFQ